MTCSGVFSTLYDELGILFSVWAPDGRSRLSVGNQDPAGRGTSRRPAVDGAADAGLPWLQPAAAVRPA
jgi:hypothetical protein